MFEHTKNFLTLQLLAKLGHVIRRPYKQSPVKSDRVTVKKCLRFIYYSRAADQWKNTDSFTRPISEWNLNATRDILYRLTEAFCREMMRKILGEFQSNKLMP